MRFGDPADSDELPLAVDVKVSSGPVCRLHRIIINRSRHP